MLCCRLCCRRRRGQFLDAWLAADSSREAVKGDGDRANLKSLVDGVARSLTVFLLFRHGESLWFNVNSCSLGGLIMLMICLDL